MEDTIIRSRKSLKYLGVSIGYNMNYTDHIREVATKAGKQLKHSAELCPTWWGPSAGKRKIMAVIVVYSIILYATPT